MNRLKDVMVADPVLAHGWQTVADVRRTMLVNDFSELPLSDGASEGTWETVKAKGLAAYLASEREVRLGRTLDAARNDEDHRLQICKLRRLRRKRPSVRCGTSPAERRTSCSW